MKAPTKTLTSLLKFLACGALLLALTAHAEDSKSPVAGTWTWTMPGRNGGPDRTNSLTLKVEGSKLTGKLTSPGRNGKTETEITEAKLDGDKVSFDVVREYNGNSFKASYSGKVTADKITGKIEMTRDGNPTSRDWEAKRATDSKPAETK